MMVLCILLAMLSLFLSLKLIYQRKLVQKVKKSTGIETKERLRLQKTNTLCHTGMLPSSELTNTQHQSIQTEKIKRHPMRPAVFQRIGVLCLYL